MSFWMTVGFTVIGIIVGFGFGNAYGTMKAIENIGNQIIVKVMKEGK